MNPCIRFADKESITIGRASNNEIYIPDSGVSRMHARLEWKNGGEELSQDYHVLCPHP